MEGSLLASSSGIENPRTCFLWKLVNEVVKPFTKHYVFFVSDNGDEMKQEPISPVLCTETRRCFWLKVEAIYSPLENVAGNCEANTEPNTSHEIENPGQCILQLFALFRSRVTKLWLLDFRQHEMWKPTEKAAQTTPYLFPETAACPKWFFFVESPADTGYGNWTRRQTWHIVQTCKCLV